MTYLQAVLWIVLWNDYGAGISERDVARLASLVAEEAVHRGLDVRLFVAVLRHESGFREAPHRRGSGEGVGQVLCCRWGRPSARVLRTYEGNVPWAAYILSECLHMRHGHVGRALACYNGRGEKSRNYVRAVLRRWKGL